MLPLADLAARLAVGGVVGLAAAVAMDWPMSRQPEGFTPAFVVAAIIRRSSPDAVVYRDASITHHLVGTLSGVLYAIVLTGFEGILPTIVPVGGVDLPAHLLAVVVVVGVSFLGFSRLVFPRAGGPVHEERATAVRGQWLRSSLVFGGVVLVVAPLLFAAV
ncbi:hypothetical protein [Halorarum salinum]|uniref:Uncharacterized protein n=1 Tax=Halorarum salinum TaxID=2743089 RepID=A0A7D5QEZ3_9EURY|nr:hypothetical protein [Halobaculum salinum]QLG63121.1 hypothetical protein HUG12_15830 [Halobaculum salinum]